MTQYLLSFTTESSDICSRTLCCDKLYNYGSIISNRVEWTLLTINISILMKHFFKQSMRNDPLNQYRDRQHYTLQLLCQSISGSWKQIEQHKYPWEWAWLTCYTYNNWLNPWKLHTQSCSVLLKPTIHHLVIVSPFFIKANLHQLSVVILF